MKSVDFRRDVRSIDQFKKDIAQKTSVERILLNHWIHEMKFRGHTVQVEDYGIDNTGQFVPLSSNRPDYELHIDGKPYLYEVKQNSYSHRNSFKVYDLQQYIQMDARILLFYGVGLNGDIFYDSRWAIIHRESMERILKLPRISNDRSWGNKEIVIVYKERFNEFFRSYDFKSFS